jgi:hypothetical protein
MTEIEETEHLAWVKIKETEAKQQAKVETERAKAKQIVLDRLGITANEAALLLG